MVNPECPAVQHKRATPIDWCEINDKPCIMEDGWGCPYYEDWLFELKQEELDKKARKERVG